MRRVGVSETRLDRPGGVGRARAGCDGEIPRDAILADDSRSLSVIRMIVDDLRE